MKTKKFYDLLVVAFIGLLSSCSSEEPALNLPTSNKISLTRTPEEALTLAAQCSEISNNGVSRSTAKTIDAESIKIIGAKNSRSNTDTLIYAIDFTDNQGFVLISGNKLTEPVIGIVDEGNYEESSTCGNENFDNFMDAALSYVSDAPNSISSTEPVDRLMIIKTDTLKTVSSTGARVKVQWNQYWPENMFAPNKVAGCGPIAIAQIFSYFKPTFDVDLTFAEKTFDHLTVNWDEVNKHTLSTNYKNIPNSLIDSHYQNCDADEESHVALAALVREIGERANCIYGQSSTAIFFSDAREILSEFLYNHQIQTCTGENLYDLLLNKGIAYIHGYNPKSGHAWVGDGVARIVYNIDIYHNFNPRTREYDWKEEEVITNRYIHCNWGWAGYCDGYFLENVFDTSKPVEHPFFKTTSRSDYSRDVEGIVIY